MYGVGYIISDPSPKVWSRNVNACSYFLLEITEYEAHKNT